MKKFNVNVHCEGGWLFEIEAKTKKKQRKKQSKCSMTFLIVS